MTVPFKPFSKIKDDRHIIISLLKDNNKKEEKGNSRFYNTILSIKYTKWFLYPLT